MNQENPDLLFGVVVLIIFLILVFMAGKVLYAYKNGRLTRAWDPLVPIIRGTVVGDGGGAATSWLSGTYQGRNIQASIVPNRNKYSGESGVRYNYFDVALTDEPGLHDWSIRYETALLSFGPPTWRINTQDKALRAALEQADLIATLARFGTPAIEYRRQQKQLIYSEDVTPRWLPTPDRFTEQLELLLQATDLNHRINPAV